MPSEEITEPLAHLSGDQGEGEQEDSGYDNGDGAESDDQSSSGDDESSSNSDQSDDNSISDDDADNFLEALANGDLDKLDDDGKPVESKDDESEDEKPKEKDAPVDDAKKDDEPPADDKKPEESETDLTAEEQADLAKASKGQRKSMQRLFDERSELRKQNKELAEAKSQLEPAKGFADRVIADLIDVGLASDTDGKLDMSHFRKLIEVERVLSKKEPKDVAAYYRRMADTIHPESAVVTLAEDLTNMVEAGHLPVEEAKLIQRERDAKKAPPVEHRKPDHEAETRRNQEAANVQAEKHRTEGLRSISEVFAPHSTRMGAEWAPIRDEIIKALQPLVKVTDPSGWKLLAETQVKLALAERRAAQKLKTPTKTPAQSGERRRNQSDILSEEDELNAIANGKF